MGEEAVEAEGPVEVLVQQPVSATWKETWDNVIFPTLFGLAVGAAWQALLSPHLTYGLPNPPQGALIVMMLCSPLLHKMLTPHSQSMWLDYLGGIAVLALPLMFVWSTGLGGFVCGGYLAVVVWIWLSTSWWRFHLPPFRLAMWHTLGVNIGALGGSLLYFSLLG
ncbi:MAG: hypothetical protein VW982_00910 [Candidatus Poseidoniales archaeon]|jgi:hypothetical protein